MVQGTRTLYFLRHGAPGRKERNPHRRRTGRVLRALSLRFAGTVRDLAAAPQTQSLVRAAALRIEPQKFCLFARASAPPSGKGLSSFSFGSSHRAKHPKQERGI